MSVTTPYQVKPYPEILDMGITNDNRVIVNDSVNRVWIGQSTGVSPGTGTPLDSKTSMRIGPGHWRAMADVAVASTSQLYLSPDTDQWAASPVAIALAILASGVAIVDKPTVKALAFPTSLGSSASNASPSADMSQFQSWMMWLQWQTTNPFEYMLVELEWFDANGAPIRRNHIRINSNVIGQASPARVNIRGPVIGSSVVITVTNLGSAGALHTYNFAFWGSYRTCERLWIQEEWTQQTVDNTTDGTDGAVCSYTTSSTGVASITIPIAVHWGVVDCRFRNGATATASVDFQIVDPIAGVVVYDSGLIGAGGVNNTLLQLAARPYKLSMGSSNSGLVMKPTVSIVCIND